MQKYIIKIFGLAILFLGTLVITSCNKDDEVEGIDKQLYDMSKSTDGFTWFKNTGELLDKSSGSGHSFQFLRTRFNPTAATKLDSTGRIMADAIFPEGSLIVKELYGDANSLDRYAILYKDSDNSSADANGWVWGYINSDESVAVSATDKGNQCIGCHTQDGSIDYMLMNKFFP